MTEDLPPDITLVVVFALAAATAAVVYLITRRLTQSISALSDRTPVVTAMGILGVIGLVAVIGALFTSQEQAWTIGATVVGGLVGFLTAETRKPPPDDEGE